MTRRVITPAMRREMLELRPHMTVAAIAAKFGFHKSNVSRALNSRPGPRRGVDPLEAQEMRSAWPDMTYRQICAKWGYAYGTVRDVIKGVRYPELPGAHKGNLRRSGFDIAAYMAKHRAERKINVHEKLILHRL